jgi:aspartyl aminopeptidase
MPHNDGSRGQRLLDFIQASPTAYHAVDTVSRRLSKAGFQTFNAADEWDLQVGSRGQVIRDGSLVAFRVGTRPVEECGFLVLGAHTDSPNLRVKPQPAYEAEGCWMLGTEVYGGVLLSTWLDRDLGLAGRVALHHEGGAPELRLLDMKRPIGRVPNLAIHLNRDVNQAGLIINPQKHLPVLLGLAPSESTPQAAFLDLLAGALKVAPERIIGHDLGLYDTQPGVLGGVNEDLLFAPRLDNLASCFACLEAFEALGDTPSATTQVMALFDHEEVGSRSQAGAQGPLLEHLLRRLMHARDRQPEGQAYERAIAQSFSVSLDMAHAVHPNYAEQHEPRHMPRLGGGPVIKTNTQQAYATDGASQARFLSACRRAGFEPQHFVVRSDLACGSTIGPISAARIGIKTVDVGNPMLSMHSSREMASALDLDRLHDALMALLSQDRA